MSYRDVVFMFVGFTVLFILLTSMFFTVSSYMGLFHDPEEVSLVSSGGDITVEAVERNAWGDVKEVELHVDELWDSTVVNMYPVDASQPSHQFVHGRLGSIVKEGKTKKFSENNNITVSSWGVEDKNGALVENRNFYFAAVYEDGDIERIGQMTVDIQSGSYIMTYLKSSSLLSFIVSIQIMLLVMYFSLKPSTAEVKGDTDD